MYANIALGLLLYSCTWYGIGCALRRNDVADIAWGLGFVIMSWFAYSQSDHAARGLLVNTLVTIWGIRLAWHIAKRNWNKPEDHRYAAWRQTWTFFYLRSLFQIFLLQGVFLYVILFPVLFIHASRPAELRVIDAAAVVIWICGFLFESIADRQLKDFLANPAHKGKIMDQGLWAYSRHPNYFGEVVQWWAIFLLALPVPGGSVTVIGPLLITFLILFVSGVPMLERKYAGRADFEAYKKRTSMFLPLPRR